MVSSSPLSPAAFGSVEEALAELTRCLQVWVPFRTWLVTRVEGDDQTILQAADLDGKLHRGQVMPWSESYCTRMVNEGAPRFAEDAQVHEVYRTAAVNARMQIGAYLGQPLVADDGAVLGVLCALDPQPQRPLTPEQRLLVETITKTMGLLLNSRLKAEKARQQEAQMRYRSETDQLTGLANRRGWEQALAEEGEAIDAVGTNAMVMMVDLDGLKTVNDTQGHAAGDQLIVDAARVLQEQLRDVDIVARLGGDEFAVLARGFSVEVARSMVQRLQAGMAAAQVGASVGFAMRRDHGSLAEALAAADALMYENKQLRRQLSRHGPRWSIRVGR